MKEIEDMTFDEFCQWAAGYIIFHIGGGETLKSIMWGVMNNFVLNWLPTHGWKKTI